MISGKTFGENTLEEDVCKDVVEMLCRSLKWEVKPYYPSLLQLWPWLCRKLWESRFKDMFFRSTTSGLLLNRPCSWPLRKIYSFCALRCRWLEEIFAPLAIWMPQKFYDRQLNPKMGRDVIARGKTYAELFSNLGKAAYEHYYPFVGIPAWMRECSSPEEMAMKIHIQCIGT